MTRITPILLALLGASCGRQEPSEVESQVAAHGLDYRTIRRQAERDARALSRYFDLWRYTDAAGSESYAGHLSELLRGWGETPFLKALDSTPPRTRDSILGLIAYDNGLGNSASEWARFSARYPLLAHRAGGAR